ncbi:MFS transporter [Ideonella sp.]|uniref:MFS transporter n=1 Tax=Ideonella sp. TaxID=1929293 RepID=UPI003BB5F920
MNKISLREKVAYSGGDFAFNLVFGTITSFLLFFYTDVFGISAAEAGAVLLVARLWDAVWDLFLGALIDRTSTRWGQLRPYLMFGAPLLALAAVACFTTPDWGHQGKLLYAFASYMLLMTCYSLVNIPYGALPTLMSESHVERTTLASWRMFFAFAGTMFVGAAAQALVGVLGEGDRGLGYQRVMIVFGTAACLLIWACAYFCRERVPPITGPRGDIKKDAAVLFKSRAWVCLAVCSLLAFSVLLLPVANAVYYMSYVAARPDHIPVYLILSGASMMLAAVISGIVTKIFCKRSVWRAGSLGAIVFLSAVFFIDPKDLPLLYAVTIVANVFIGVTIPINFSMASDVADQIELDHDRRMPGMVFSGLAFAGKAGLGLGGALAGALLAGFGYVANAQQSPEAIVGIKLCMSLIPAAGCVLLLGVQMLYPLNREGLTLLGAQLSRKRALSAPQPA